MSETQLPSLQPSFLWISSALLANFPTSWPYQRAVVGVPKVCSHQLPLVCRPSLAFWCLEFFLLRQLSSHPICLLISDYHLSSLLVLFLDLWVFIFIQVSFSQLMGCGFLFKSCILETKDDFEALLFYFLEFCYILLNIRNGGKRLPVSFCVSDFFGGITESSNT